MPFIGGGQAQMRDPHPGPVIHQLEFCQSIVLHIEHEVGKLSVVEVVQLSFQVVPEYPSILSQSMFSQSPHLWPPPLQFPFVTPSS